MSSDTAGISRHPRKGDAAEGNAMKNISIDNGRSYCTVEQALEAYNMGTWSQYMDDETREAVAAEIAPCTESEFLAAYLDRAAEDLVIG
ncbi:MAG: hypothetical protein VB039_05195 [Oscillospiraceae bacterium]|nr:hypothetical protein [Oscillospiraceae bacterium]